MENKEDNSGHVSKLVHQFYFVKLWPTDPDSISKIKKEENILMKLNQEINEITTKIAKKMGQREHMDSKLKNLKCKQSGCIYRASINEKILSDFNMALDELNFKNVEVENGGWFGEKLDKTSLNYLKLHGSKSLAEERKFLRDIKTQQKDVASFKSLEVLKETLLGSGGSIFFNHEVKKLKEMIRRKYDFYDRQNLVIEIEEFQNHQMERETKTNTFKNSLKKTTKDQIKILGDEVSSKNKRKWKEYGAKIIRCEKEFEAIKRDNCSLNSILIEKYKLKNEANQMILNLKKLYHEEILDYYRFCSLVNKVHQLAEEKDVAAIDEISSSEVEKFMLEWNNNKAFREDYEKKVLRSLERRQLSRDGRIRREIHAVEVGRLIVKSKCYSFEIL